MALELFRKFNTVFISCLSILVVFPLYSDFVIDEYKLLPESEYDPFEQGAFDFIEYTVKPIIEEQGRIWRE